VTSGAPGVPCAITDISLCAAAAASYSTTASVEVGDVHAVLTLLGGLTVVAFRGTVPTSWEDWFRDFSAWPARVVDHPTLGLCHDGFVMGAEAILPLLQPKLSGPYVLTGHSLGGALAIALGALMTDCGRPPLRLTTFGAPRVGMKMLAAKLALVRGTRYRHGADPVPEVPSWPYLNDRSWTAIGEANDFDPIGDHAISRYALSLAALPTAIPTQEPAT
jgi:hypothetical protein